MLGIKPKLTACKASALLDVQIGGFRSIWRPQDFGTRTEKTQEVQEPEATPFELHTKSKGKAKETA